MAVKCIDIMKKMEEWAPVELAEAWDNTGLIVGDSEASVKKILVALDVTEKVIDEALAADVDMIITHHPLIFQSVKKITADTSVGNKILRLARHKISAYAAHTNLDIANGGTNDVLAELLGIKDLEILEETGVNRHGAKEGIGRIGNLENTVTFKDFAVVVKKRLGLSAIGLVGKPDALVRRVGLCTGSGAEFLEKARKQGADAYVSSDIKFHEAQRALELGLCVADATHYASEQLIVPVIAKYLGESGFDVEILESKVNGQTFWHLT